MESGILGFKIWNTAQGIRNLTNNWNLESKFHWQSLAFSTWIPESTAWNPESKTVLGSLTWSNKKTTSTFMMPPLVSPWNDIWGTSAEIPYWWRVTTQIWVQCCAKHLNQKNTTYSELTKLPLREVNDGTRASSSWRLSKVVSPAISKLLHYTHTVEMITDFVSNSNK